MNKSSNKQSDKIELNVMKKIHEDKLQIRPKSYYIFLGVLSTSTIILLLMISTYLISIFSLWLRVSLAQGPAYGAKQNLASLISSFPWWIIIPAVISTIGLIYLIKKSSKAYKIRLAYLIPIILIIITTIGMALSYISLPNRFDNRRLDDSCLINDSHCIPILRGFGRNNLIK
jgi:hypothetical protein